MIKQLMSLLLANLLNDGKRRRKVLSEICMQMYERTGLHCTIGDLKIGITGRIIVSDIEASYQGTTLLCKEITMDLSYFSLVRRVVRIRYLQLTIGKASLILSPAAVNGCLRIKLRSRSPLIAEASAKKVYLDCKSLSPKRFLVPSFSVFAEAYRKDGAFILSERSNVSFCSLKAGLFLKYDPDPGLLEARLNIPRFTPGEILAAFPEFVCKDLYTLDAKGNISMNATLSCSLSDPDRFAFDVSFGQESFVLNNKEQLIFNDLRSALFHRIAFPSPDGPDKIIEISDREPGFIKLRDLPEILIQIVVSSEDPNFFSHPGIDWKFIGQALLVNFRNRRITKGGSTITMQLVRNLYLGHARNMYRKLEEVIIAWLLEGVIRIPKRRILEIYLNIIEFAPGIYGIKQASEYYFSKPPSRLSLTECIVLSYIIPRPKFFEEAWLNSSEKLVRNLKIHLKVVSERLLNKGLITAGQFESVNGNISIMQKTLLLT